MFSARITSPKKIEIEDIATPTIVEGQCLIKLEKWSVCGSDIRHAYGPVHPEEEYPMRHGGACHECAGTIVESKSDKFKVGQRVIVLPSSDGPGGLVEYYPGDEGRMALVPDHGDLGEWILCQPSGTVLYACQLMGTILGKDVVVMGQGSIGLSFTAICARAGARKVIAVDPLDYRLEWGTKFGATHTINSEDTDPVDTLYNIINGGVDFVFDMVGIESIREQTILAAKAGVPGFIEGGTTVLVGFPHGVSEFNPRSILMGQRTYKGSRGGGCIPKDDFPKFYEDYRTNKLNLNDAVTRRIKMDDINDAILDLQSGIALGRIVIEID